MTTTETTTGHAQVTYHEDGTADVSLFLSAGAIAPIGVARGMTVAAALELVAGLEHDGGYSVDLPSEAPPPRSEVGPELLELVERCKAIHHAMNRLPSWGRPGIGLGFDRNPVFAIDRRLSAEKTLGRRGKPVTAADVLEAVRASLELSAESLENFTGGFRAFADEHKQTEDELAAIRRDVAAVRRLFGTEVDR